MDLFGPMAWTLFNIWIFAKTCAGIGAGTGYRLRWSGARRHATLLVIACYQFFAWGFLMDYVRSQPERFSRVNWWGIAGGVVVVWIVGVFTAESTRMDLEAEEKWRMK